MPAELRYKQGILRRRSLLGLLVGLLLVGSTLDAGSTAEALPSGFQESVVFTGLTNPTAVRFASDGRVFVGEKSGLVKVFDSLSDPTPTVFADLRTNTYNFWDRGLLGMTLDPQFPTDPYVYVLYSYDAEIGGTAPRWGTPGACVGSLSDPTGADWGRMRDLGAALQAHGVGQCRDRA